MIIDIREPFPEFAWPLAWEWLDKARAQALDDFGPSTPDEFVEYSRRAYARTWGIWKDDLLSGAVAIGQDTPAVATVHILLSVRLWGIPREDLRKVGALLFESQPRLQRIQAFIPVWNRLAIAMARRMGGIVEGIMRGATVRGGKPHDVVLLGVTREEFGNGTGTRRIDGRDQLELEQQQQRQHIERVLSGADFAPVDADERAGDGRGGGDVGSAVAGSAGGRDERSGPDQQNVERSLQPGKQLPRVARLRQQRDKRADEPAGGTGKTKRAGRKRG